jgi:hypothetical protein
MGALLLSQAPDDFLKDDKYVPDLILAFLEKWEPKRGGASGEQSSQNDVDFRPARSTLQ